MQDVLEKSDHLMATAKDLFVDFPRRRTGKVVTSHKSFFILFIKAQPGCLKEFKIFSQASYYFYHMCSRVDSIQELLDID